jgi:hypothetical protein
MKLLPATSEDSQQCGLFKTYALLGGTLSARVQHTKSVMLL